MTSVNRPTNVKQKEQDVNNKLQLYGIFTAFSNGKVPSNEQIDVALNSFMKQSFMTTPSKKLSAEGQDLVKDFRDVVEAAKVLLLTKNHGNLLQDFIWESQNIDGANASTPNAPIDKETAKQHGNQALGGLRTLGTLIVSNGQFRKLLNDATILLRDMAGDAAQKAADKVNPSEEDLKQIDRPADDNTWHDVPDMSKDNIKNQLKDTYNKNTPVTGQDLKDAAGDASQEAHPSGSRDPRDVGRAAAKDQQYNTSSGVDAASGAASGLQTLKDRASQNIPDEHKDKARELKETGKNKTKNYLSKKMPEERRDQTIWRLKKMLVEIQGHPDYNEAITTLLSLAEEYTGHTKNVTGQAVNSAQDAHGDTSLQRAEYDLKTLIERFANNTSTDDLFDSINNLYRDADRDPELKNWFKRLDAFIRKCLQQQGYVLEDRATDEYNELYDRGNFLLRDRYRNHTDRVLDEFKFLGDQFDKDPLNRRFADACQKLFEDLGNDENGQPTFKPHLVKDLTEVILPAAFEGVRYVPVPRIEYSDPMIDAIVENLVIESDNLTPNLVEFASDNYWRWGRKGIANRNKNAVMISVSGVQMDLRDVSYYVKKKQGFPGLTDLGVADIFLGGSGFSFKIRVETADAKDRHNFFKVNKVDVDVKNFNIKLKQSRHKTLFALSKPIMLKVMRPALQKVLEKVIKEKFFELDQLLYSIKQEADRATAEAKDDPENIPNLYSRYTSAAQKKLFEGKKKAQEVAADKKANVAMTQHDSIFPNIKLPGGISSKATEYKELAAKGDKWQSPIFTIGSAKTSSNLPSTAPEVSRKDHNVTEGGVRGPQNVGQTEPVSRQINDATPSGTGLGAGAGSTGLGAGAGTTGLGAAGTTNGKYSNGGYTNGHSSTTNGATAFSNQVDQAFSKPTAGATTTPAAANGVTKNTGTTLGANNPVFNGTAR